MRTENFCKNHQNQQGIFFLADQPWTKFCSECALNMALCGKKIDKDLTAQQFDNKTQVLSILERMKNRLSCLQPSKKIIDEVSERIDQYSKVELVLYAKKFDEYVRGLCQIRDEIMSIISENFDQKAQSYFEKQTKMLLFQIQLKEQLDFIETNYQNIIESHPQNLLSKKMQEWSQLLEIIDRSLPIQDEKSIVEDELNRNVSTLKDKFESIKPFEMSSLDVFVKPSTKDNIDSRISESVCGSSTKQPRKTQLKLRSNSKQKSQKQNTKPKRSIQALRDVSNFQDSIYHRVLRNYYTTGMTHQVTDFFPEARTFPDFFNQNLLDEHRILKIIEGRHCWARAFYYQYLKILFEIEGADTKSPNHKQIMLSIFEQSLEKSPRQVNQHKLDECLKIVQDFIYLSDTSPGIKFQEHLSKNSEIDLSFIQLLTLIISQGEYLGAQNEQKIKYLGTIFDLAMFEFESGQSTGLKFEESDTFVYFDNEDAIYLAFLNYPQEIEDYQPSQNKDISIDKIQQVNTFAQLEQSQQNGTISDSQHNNKIGSLDPYIPIQQTINDISNYQESPTDYLTTQKYRSNSHSIKPSSPPRIPNYSPLENITPTDSIKENPSYFNNRVQNTSEYDYTISHKQGIMYGSNSQKQINETNTYGSQFYRTVQQNSSASKFKPSSEVINDRPGFGIKNRLNLETDGANQVQKSLKHENLFYKPGSIKPYVKPTKKDPLDICNESQKGTFYRKFTDTRILNLLSQPYRTKIKMLKNRFAGVRSQDHRINIRDQPY